MLLVGLTGGVGSGKSEVTRRLADRGAVVVDADVVAREVVAAGTPGLAAVVDEFGPSVVRADGTLDRAGMAERVFHDAEARARLNAIVHPLVRVETDRLVRAAPPDAIVVNDVPLLVETGAAGRFDVVVVVTAPADVRMDRLVRLRGMSEADARARMDAQAPHADRLAVADYVVANDGSLADLDARVDALWAALRGRQLSA